MNTRREGIAGNAQLFAWSGLREKGYQCVGKVEAEGFARLVGSSVGQDD